MLVSTSLRPDPKLLKQAERMSARIGGRLVPREKRSVGELRELIDDQTVLLATKDGLRLYSDDSQPLFFHPGMAAIRVQRLQGGDTDPLVTTTAVEPGDTVLDCTAGLASDAIVLSCVAGETGRVTALESEPLIYCLLEDGLARYIAEQDEITEAMRRIRLIGREHTC
jgi:tRNA A58 N-methylase Trm61